MCFSLFFSPLFHSVEKTKSVLTEILQNFQKVLALEQMLMNDANTTPAWYLTELLILKFAAHAATAAAHSC